MMLTLATARSRSDATARARAEFLEMPGLCLTLAQASRLWDLSPLDGQRVFDELIADGLLCRRGDLYVRADLGTVLRVRRDSVATNRSMPASALGGHESVSRTGGHVAARR